MGIIPLVAGVVTTLRTSAKNSIRKLIDCPSYTGNSGKQEVKLELLIALHVDIQKAAKWHGLGDTL